MRRNAELAEARGAGAAQIVVGPGRQLGTGRLDAPIERQFLHTKAGKGPSQRRPKIRSRPGRRGRASRIARMAAVTGTICWRLFLTRSAGS